MSDDIFEDRGGDVHVLGEDQRMLVLAKTEAQAHDWLVSQGLQPYSRRFTLVGARGGRLIEGGHWDVVVYLEGRNLAQDQQVWAMRRKSKTPILMVLG